MPTPKHELNLSPLSSEVNIPAHWAQPYTSCPPEAARSIGNNWRSPATNDVIPDVTLTTMRAEQQPEAVTPNGLVAVDDASVDPSLKHINAEENANGEDGLLLSPVSAVSEGSHSEAQLPSLYRLGSDAVTQSRGFSMSNEFSNVRVGRVG